MAMRRKTIVAEMQKAEGFDRFAQSLNRKVLQAPTEDQNFRDLLTSGKSSDSCSC